MRRTSIAARAFTRTGVSAVIVALVVSITTLPAAAGTIPVINGFLPHSGAVGATVHVYGANFTGATAVRFNGTSATPFTISGPGNIQTTVPTGATSGRISVTTPAGTGTSTIDFTVTTTGPTITSFSPTSGSVGSPVVINGTGFTNVSAVRFNGISSPFTVVNATSINATVQAGATTDSEESISIRSGNRQRSGGLCPSKSRACPTLARVHRRR